MYIFTIKLLANFITNLATKSLYNSHDLFLYDGL